MPRASPRRRTIHVLNNEAIESTTVIAAADLAQETDTPDHVPTGQRVTSVLSRKWGPAPATDTLPLG
jgi:hypothetical protein